MILGRQRVAQVLFILGALACLSSYFSSALALLSGALLALTLGNPFVALTRTMTHRLLAYSVAGLGAGMNLITVGQVGAQGIAYTVIGIAIAFVLGTALGKWLKTDRNPSLLITMGTAICGGSAIAALSPVLRAKHHEVSVALGTVFLLNAVALFLFPQIGHLIPLSESQFGLWSALAIHDTSSVVGATLGYGPHALQVGTTVKLARALWIVPLTLVFGVVLPRFEKNRDSRAETGKRKYPWFILGFLGMAAAVTWIPQLRPLGQGIERLSKQVLVLTLFFIGSNLTQSTFKAVGFRPLVQGVILWVLLTAGTLFSICQGWIRVSV